VQQPIKSPLYTEYHPRWYRPRVSVYWWLGQWQYLRFILRELSSVFVALTVIMTLLELRALAEGPAAYERFQHQMGRPAIVLISVISLFFVIFHTITWFNLTPRAMAVKLRGKRIPEWLVAAPNYLAWLVVSGAITFVVLRG
jgi:fumarate reductase subunit C